MSLFHFYLRRLYRHHVSGHKRLLCDLIKYHLSELQLYVHGFKLGSHSLAEINEVVPSLFFHGSGSISLTV